MCTILREEELEDGSVQLCVRVCIDKVRGSQKVHREVEGWVAQDDGSVGYRQLDK